MDLRRSRRDAANSTSAGGATVGTSYRSIDLHVLQSKVQKAIEAASMTVLKNVDHCRTLGEGLWMSFKAGHMVDIAIHCHGHSTRAHRVVLSVFSPVLRASMAPPPPQLPSTSTDARSTINMQSIMNAAPPLCICLDDVVHRAHDLDILLEFMYRGEVSLPKTGLESLLRTAELLEIWSLVDAIKDQYVHLGGSSTNPMSSSAGASSEHDLHANANTGMNQDQVVEQMTIKLEPADDREDLDEDHVVNDFNHFESHADDACMNTTIDMEVEPSLNADQNQFNNHLVGVDGYMDNDDDDDDDLAEVQKVPKIDPDVPKMKVRFRCQYCSKAFSSNQAYVVHHKEHADPASRRHNRENQCPKIDRQQQDATMQMIGQLACDNTTAPHQDLVPVQLIKSNKGKDLLVHQDYIYRLDRIRGGSRYWRCNHYDSFKCKARSVTIDNVVSEVRGTHNHLPEKATVDAKQLHSSIKDLATSTDESVQSIIASVTVGIDPSASSPLPKENTIRRIIRRTRNELTAPTKPTNLRELAIPHLYSTTLDNEDFLLFDSGPSDDRIVLFSTNHNLQLLLDSPHWYANGTFKTTPPLFQQLYTIHAIRFGEVVPVVFLLLPNKRLETYERAFNALKSIRPNLSPSTILTNFETEEMNALASCFEAAVRHGCQFHLGYSVWNRIKQHHMCVMQHCTDDPSYGLSVRQLLCLSFVPVDQIHVKFEELLGTEFFHNADSMLKQFLDHFEDTFIGCRTRDGGQRRAPIFKHALWNCYDATKAFGDVEMGDDDSENASADDHDVVVINDGIESWHRRFDSLIVCSRPSIWKFIVKLKKEQANNNKIVLQLLAGVRPQASSRYQQNSAKRANIIRTIVKDFANRNLTEYLTALAEHVDFYI